jgi:hypothetical protein
LVVHDGKLVTLAPVDLARNVVSRRGAAGTGSRRRRGRTADRGPDCFSDGERTPQAVTFTGSKR